jgi:tetratricopeptide (TPR) repeat protein
LREQGFGEIPIQFFKKSIRLPQIRDYVVSVAKLSKKTGSSRKKLTAQELRDLDLEISFMEGLVKRDDRHVEALLILGDNYTRRGRYEEGLRMDERLCALRPEDCMVHYNLACSYALTRQCDLAAAALERAVALGYDDFDFMAKDPDLKNLREHASYKRISAKGRRQQVREG